MSRNIVADFNAFLSATADGEPVFETREGRVVITRDELAVADGNESRRLPLDNIAEFDFRTVPEGWEQFFDDLVGIRFDGDVEVTVTVGADTEVVDRFVTILLKLILEATTAQVGQRLKPLDGDAELYSAESSITLQPKSERIQFDGDEMRPIDVSAVTNVSVDGSGVFVRHLDEDGRLSTEVTLDNARGSQFFETYLAFRTELAERSGPVRFLYVGDDRDTLVLVAKLLKHRNVTFEAGHASSGEELFTALESMELTTKCVVTEYDLGETRGDQLRDRLDDSGYDVSLVVLARDGDEGIDLGGSVDVVHIGSCTEHYEDIADAIERAAIASRTD